MEIAVLILNSLLLLCVAWAGIWVRSYIKQKGDNFATIQDIAKITDEIERVRSDYNKNIVILKSEIQFQTSLREAFREKSIQAIEEINQIFVSITKHCWKELANRIPNEHYVWSAVDDTDEKHGFHYFRVALDKAILENALYLSEQAEKILRNFSSTIGSFSSMELALLGDDPHPAVLESAEPGYRSVLKAVKKCRMELLAELRGFSDTNTDN